MSYHEQLAQSVVVGSPHSYAEILATLQARFPEEKELRRYVGVVEKMAQMIAAGFRFVAEK